MKLIIQIPCFNEEEILPRTLAELPREVEGFDTVEWLVIDDGSTDATSAVAKANGVDHVIHHSGNKGLARAFMSGIEACLRLGADVIVNTDADNQYNAADIPLLTQPIVNGDAEIVIGERPIDAIRSFSPMKKTLQKVGSWAVRVASHTNIPDAPSGFRALSREAAKKVMVFNRHTYTLETIIQAGQNNLAIRSVPIRVNPETRRSRLIRSIPEYLTKSVITILRIFIIYRPFLFFGSIGSLVSLAGFVLGLRFVWFYLIGQGDGHIQSLILSSILLVVGFQTILIAFVADLLAANRRLLEEIRQRSFTDADHE